MYEGYGATRHKRSGVETYQASATWLVRDAINRSNWRPGRQVVIEFYMHLKGPVDGTNVMKVIEDGVGEAMCRGDRPPTCCRKYDDRFLCRAMELTTGNAEPRVELIIR
jgi:hypothetical protein